MILLGNSCLEVFLNLTDLFYCKGGSTQPQNIINILFLRNMFQPLEFAEKDNHPIHSKKWSLACHCSRVPDVRAQHIPRTGTHFEMGEKQISGINRGEENAHVAACLGFFCYGVEDSRKIYKYGESLLMQKYGSSLR